MEAKSRRQEFEERKQAVVSGLMAIGESRLAADFREATEKCSFEAVEYFLRQQLKGIGPDNPSRAIVLANAIYEAQVLPTMWQPAGCGK